MKEKAKLLFACVGVLAAVSLVFFESEARAFQLDEQGKFTLGGYIEHQIGVRLSHGAKDLLNEVRGEKYLQDKGDISISRTSLFLDFGARFNDIWQFKSISRVHYESMWNLDDSIYQKPKDDESRPHRDGLDMDFDMEFREYYFTFSGEALTLKIGKQQVAWGEADSIRIADVINPLDLSWYWSFPAWEEIRIPLHMVDAIYSFPDSTHNVYIETVWVPDFRSHQYAAPGANWDFLTQIGVPTNVADVNRRQQSSDLPDRRLDDFQGGIRVGALFNEWDCTLFGWYGRDHLGVNTLNFGVPALFRYHYPKTFKLGATAAGYWAPVNSAIRFESAFTFDQPYQTRNYNFLIPGVLTFDDIGVGGTSFEEKDTFEYMLGFDHHRMIPFLNRTKSFWFSGQFFQKYIFSYDEDDPSKQLWSFLGDDDKDDVWTVGSLLINTEYYEGKIEPQVLAVEFFDSSSGFFDGHITYKHNYTLKFVLGFLNIWGNRNNAGLFYGPTRHNDEVYFKAKLTF
ncbi:MAG: DUF1302 family protein [Deltaproteobacteria bacterium]|nr:DUF1302 family protein [Deltaproteobacteria bacterium]